MRVIKYSLFLLIGFALSISAQEYVGTKTCGMCHKKPDQGEQLKIWQESGHANAYKTLLTEKADKIAGGKAVENENCLKCHATGHNVDASLLGKRFSIEDGVQCETCHGAGSEYKSKKIMEDHAKSVAAGMTEYKNEAAIEAQCKTCHNEESPTYKEFKFQEMWAKIKHPVPAEG